MTICTLKFNTFHWEQSKHLHSEQKSGFFSPVINSIIQEHVLDSIYQMTLPGVVVQSVTCQATDGSLTADPGIASSIPGGPILSWLLIMK